MENLFKLPSRVTAELLTHYQRAALRWHRAMILCEIACINALIFLPAVFLAAAPTGHSLVLWATEGDAWKYDPTPTSLTTKLMLVSIALAAGAGWFSTRSICKWIAEAKQNVLRCLEQHQPGLLVLLKGTARLE